MTASTESALSRRRRELSAGLRATWLSILGNALLAVFKLWVGILTRSQALVADGVHSLSDLLSDGIVIIGLKWGRKGEDRDHHWGHARIESIAAMVIGLILMVLAAAIAYSAVLAIVHHRTTNVTALTIGVALVSILVKEWLYRYTIAVGRQIGSRAMVGNAWHHRTDALSSVAVLIGCGAVYINPDWHIADALAAIVVAGFIGKVGVRLIWETFKEVVDTAPDPEVVRQVMEQASDVNGVRQVHDIRARCAGQQVFLEIHVVVDPNVTVRDGHAIAKQVEHRLIRAIPEVTRVITHVDPDPKEA